MSKITHCDYCDTEVKDNDDHVGWLRLFAMVETLVVQADPISRINFDLCPSCAKRVSDLSMTIKRGLADS